MGMLAVNPNDQQYSANADVASNEEACVPLDLNALLTAESAAEKIARLPALAGLSVRLVGDSDLPFLAEVYAAARADEMAATGWPQAQASAFLNQQFEMQHRYYQEHHADAHFLVLMHRDQPIGRLYWNSYPQKASLIDISLLARWRGQGIGSALMTLLTEEADKNSQSILLHVEPNNPAHRLYRRFGFKVISDNGVYLKMQRDARGVQA
jgi:ribosomal protein S18 acetylase RimI-like enzyme